MISPRYRRSTTQVRDGLKSCNKCGEVKPATPEYFRPHDGCRGGIAGTCCVCINAASKRWKANNRERVGARRRLLYATRNGEIQRRKEAERKRLFPLQSRAAALIDGLRARCRKNGWVQPAEFRSKKFFMDWLSRQPTCECCGIKFRIEIERDQPKIPSPTSPSLDRFDISVPYTVKNTALICWRCNNIKRDYSASDLRTVADWIDRRRCT
jgi:hypothetical protein